MKFTESRTGQADIDAVVKVIQDGALGFGPNVPEFEQAFLSAFTIGKQHATAFNSESSAAFVLFAYLKDKHGSLDVYMPSNSFTSVAWAALQHGHRVHTVPVGIDCMFDWDSYVKLRQWQKDNYDRAGVRTDRPRVLVPMLYGGVTRLPENFSPDPLKDIVILDSAHCLTPNCEYDYGLFSFHPVKPLVMPQGGLLATNDDKCKQYCDSYRNFGRVPRERQGFIPTYNVVETGGGNFYMNNLSAAMGLSQIKSGIVFDNRLLRKQVFEKIESKLHSYFTDDSHGVGRLLIPHDDESWYYLMTIRGSTYELSDQDSIPVAYHYPSLDGMDYYMNHKDFYSWTDRISYETRSDLGIYEYMSTMNLGNIPLHANLTDEEIETIASTINGLLTKDKSNA